MPRGANLQILLNNQPRHDPRGGSRADRMVGLVTPVPNRGVFVRQMSVREMYDVYEFRGLLFGFAAERAPSGMWWKGEAACWQRSNTPWAERVHKPEAQQGQPPDRPRRPEMLRNWRSDRSTQHHVMTDTAPITDANPTVAEMEARVARFKDLKPTADYVDSGIPGCERTTLRVIGQQPGAPLAADGFHMSIVCCEAGKAAPLHNHLTQEVFVVLTGTWEIFWGPDGQRKATLAQWDTISIPPGVSRGFRNVGNEVAYLIGMASGADPGMINWPEPVRAAARAVGIALP